MDLSLTEEQDMITASVRRYVREEIVPLELNLDPDADELPAEDKARLIKITQSMGLYGLDIPVEYGGPDIDLVTRQVAGVEARVQNLLNRPFSGAIAIDLTNSALGHHGGAASSYDGLQLNWAVLETWSKVQPEVPFDGLLRCRGTNQ